MAQNPYEAPQQLGRMTIPNAEQNEPWHEPLRTKILSVARNQRWVNLHFLFAIAAAFLLVVFMPKGGLGEGPLGLLVIVLLLANMICLVYRVYKLSSALEYTAPPLMALACFLGIIGIVIIALLSGEANKFLKKFNIKVGLLGANPNTVEQMLNQAQQAASPLPMAQAWSAPPR